MKAWRSGEAGGRNTGLRRTVAARPAVLLPISSPPARAQRPVVRRACPQSATTDRCIQPARAPEGMATRSQFPSSPVTRRSVPFGAFHTTALESEGVALILAPDGAVVTTRRSVGAGGSAVCGVGVARGGSGGSAVVTAGSTTAGAAANLAGKDESGAERIAATGAIEEAAGRPSTSSVTRPPIPITAAAAKAQRAHRGSPSCES